MDNFVENFNVWLATTKPLYILLTGLAVGFLIGAIVA